MKKAKLPSLISVLILTLITAVMWISLSVYRAFTSKVPTSVPKEISEPLNPNLDKDTINAIEGKTFLDDSQVPDVVAAGSTAPLATSIPTPTSVPSPTPENTATPEATPTP